MTPTSDLFLLIRSMSKSEKRHFKLSALLHGRTEKNYIRLFDAIAAQTAYDEAAIRKIFSGETFIKKLDVTKIYLYKLVLQSIRSFQSSGMTEARLKNLLIEVEILFDRSLFSQALKILEKARELALKHEKHGQLIEISGWKKRIMRASLQLKNLRSSIHDIFRDEMDQIEKLKNAVEYDYLEYKMHVLKRRELHPRTKKALAEYKAIIKHPLLENERTALTHKAKLNYYGMHSDYAYATGNYRYMYEYARKRMELMEKETGGIAVNGISLELFPPIF